MTTYNGYEDDRKRLLELADTMFTATEEERQEIAEILFRMKNFNKQTKCIQ